MALFTAAEWNDDADLMALAWQWDPEMEFVGRWLKTKADAEYHAKCLEGRDAPKCAAWC